MNILDAVKLQEQYLIDLRRHFHKYPEIGLSEKETSAFICGELDKIGIPYEMVGQYGILGRIDGEKPGKRLALRADMDALAVQEDRNNLIGPKNIISVNDGVSHACGHDGHMAMLICSAKLLFGLRDQLTGTVYIAFEQCEEAGGGFAAMIEALLKEKVDTLWAIHLYAGLESGKISVDPGPRMSGGNAFQVTVHGKGGHASRPDQTVDPILCASEIIVGLSSVLSREVSPLQTAVLTTCMFHAGTAQNIIPEIAEFKGSMRYFDSEVGKQVTSAFRRVVENTAAAHRCTAEIIITPPGLPVINDEKYSEIAAQAVKKACGDAHLASHEAWMASESISTYMVHFPGVFAFLGINNHEKGTGEAHHSPKFDIDEDVLKYGVASTVQYALDVLCAY